MAPTTQHQNQKHMTSWTYDKAVGKAIYTWWRGLEHHRDVRAALRRAESPAALLLPPLHPVDEAVRKRVADLHEKLIEAAPRQPEELRLSAEALAAVAGLLAHVRVDASEHDSLAHQFADGASDGPGLSERRFERLLRRTSTPDLYSDLRRVLRQFEHRAPVPALMREVYAWVSGDDRDRVRQDWARIYYAAVIEQPPPLDVPDEDRLGVAALAWWKSLDDHRGERSVLRRCATTDDVRLTRGYHRLRKYVQGAGADTLTPERLAAAAGVLAHVRTHYTRPDDDQWKWAAFAELAASTEERLRTLDEGKKWPRTRQTPAPLKENRFKRLLRTDGIEDLYRPLIRAVRLLNGRADVVRLAGDIYFWSERTRQNWASRYYHIAEPE